MLDTRRVLKIVHELASSAMFGAVLAHGALLRATASADPAGQAALRHGIDLVARYVLVPSLGAVLMSGLVAMAIHSPFHGAGWVWIKAILGVSAFEATLGGIVGPAHRAAEISAEIAAGTGDPKLLHDEIAQEPIRLGILLAIVVVNVVLSVWRPKLRLSRASKRPAPHRPPRPSARS